MWPAPHLLRDDEELEQIISFLRRAIRACVTPAMASCVLLYLFVCVLLTEIVYQCYTKSGQCYVLNV